MTDTVRNTPAIRNQVVGSAEPTKLFENKSNNGPTKAARDSVKRGI
jgi:hypothetical protein